MKISSIIFLSFAWLARCTPLDARQVSNPSATVDTGPLTGTTTQFATATEIVNQFLGVPFGAKPVRFESPVAAPRWPGTYDATSYKPVCNQQFAFNQTLRDFTIAVFSTPGPQAEEDEDCLNLNVFAPSTASETSLKPVMFWIYGGAFTFGANSLPLYDGSYFAAEQDVVIVTINYRTNIFGFPGYPGQPQNEQNLGLLDQRLALDWVRRNIRAFGGDPDRITLFGESAGAGSVDALVTLPPDPLPFVAAIMQSGQATLAGPPPNNSSKCSWNALARNLSLSPEDAIPVVKAMPPAELTSRIERLNLTHKAVNCEVFNVFEAVKGDNVTWSATPRLNRKTGNIARVPILIGSNADEGSFFTAVSGTRWYQRTYTDSIYQCPAKVVAQESKDAGIATWRYYYDAIFPNNQPGNVSPPLGAFHSSEISEVSGTYKRDNATPRQIELSRIMMKAWADFARSPTQGPGWGTVPKVAVFDSRENQPAIREVDETEVDGQRCDYWKTIYDTLFPV